MGFVLSSLHDGSVTFEATEEAWPQFLVKLIELGWKPMGTKFDQESYWGHATEHDIKNWTGIYDSNDGAVAVDEDVQNMLAVIQQHYEPLSEQFGSDRIEELSSFLKHGSFRIN